jgi:hypothetical protein
MKSKTRGAVLIGLAAAAVAAVFLLAPTSEAGPGAIEIPLTAEFRGLITDGAPVDRILGDEKGPYINGVAVVGAVAARITKSARSNSALFYMSVDNGGDDALGRTVGFLFRDYAYPCTVDGRKDSALYMDFPIGAGTPLVKTKWVLFKSWREFILDPPSGKYYEGEGILDLLSLELNEIAYVGFSCNFRALLEGGVASDEYYMGYMWDPVEVEVTAVDTNGQPVRWAFRPIKDPAVYSNIQQDLDRPESVKPYVPARMLLQLHYPLGKKKNVGYIGCCYGIWNMPFELVLTRLQ